MNSQESTTYKKKFVSIVVPALNEELTIKQFIEWCKEGLEKAGVDGEILIIDSSTDKTSEIAESAGAKVIRVPKRGLGQAYIDAIPHIRGEYIIMGDCDCTYDFREIKSFVDKLNDGYEFVMGTRMGGYIEPGSMPPLHRYFGTPLTTFILNVIYGSNYSDIHCGMRAMTMEALKKINLESSSWEYASEMTLKSSKLNLKICEVPIKFYKDPEGRLSHHKRTGWFSPWYAGWINLKVMLLYAPDFFLLPASLISTLTGLFLVILLMMDKVIAIGNIVLSTHSIILGIMLLILGYSLFQMRILSKIIYNFNPKETLKYKYIFSYNKGVITGCLLIFIATILLIGFLHNYIISNFRLNEISKIALIGLLLLTTGFQTFTFTLIFNMILNKDAARKRKENIYE
ncbi:MAG: glycosyltransferase family 2 protein [Candidatus Eremiobacterota bacterium]